MSDKRNEVDENNNVHFLHVNNVKKPVPFYSLDVILSVGYRVKSNHSVEFRRWANSVLKQYILQGYAVNQKRIQQLGEVIRLMKRTENDWDSKLVLSVIERYNTALDLLDAYDHRNIRRPKGNESKLFGKERDDSFKGSIGNIYHSLEERKYINQWKKRLPIYFILLQKIIVFMTETSVSQRLFFCIF